MSRHPTVPGEVPAGVDLEATEVHVSVAPSPLAAHLVQAPGGTPRPGIVVAHEAWGPVEQTRDVARRFAHLGYDALVPNLYSRGQLPIMDNIPDVFAKMLALDDAQLQDDLGACIRFLRDRPGATGTVGMIGFCAGGRQTLLSACSSTPPDAAIDCWGGFVDRASPDALTTPERPIPVTDRLGDLGCPLLVVGGAEDDNPSPDVVREIGRRGTALGKDVTVQVYDNAGHAFFADHRPTYVPEAAHRLWPEIVAFFDAHLR
jgi:carboxymethylenebutenolidase